MNVLAFFAHPDDETMLAGGTLALLAYSGVHVHYLIATSGEGGEAGEPPLCRPEELGEFRAAELGCAVKALGGSSLSNLGYTDPVVGPSGALYPFTTNLTRLSSQVVSLIREKRIDALISHGSNGEYGHPAHLLCNNAARLAAASLKDKGVMLYTVAAAYRNHPKPRIANRDDPAHLILNVSSALNYKVQAALCHKTQHALFMRRASVTAGRKVKVPRVILQVESLHRALPSVGDIPQDWLADSLSAWTIDRCE